MSRALTDRGDFDRPKMEVEWTMGYQQTIPMDEGANNHFVYGVPSACIAGHMDAPSTVY